MSFFEEKNRESFDRERDFYHRQKVPPNYQHYYVPRSRTQLIKKWLLRYWFYVTLFVLGIVALYKNGIGLHQSPTKQRVSPVQKGQPATVQGSYTAADEARENNHEQPLSIGNMFDANETETPKPIEKKKKTEKKIVKKTAATVKTAKPFANLPELNVQDIVSYCKKFANVAIAERKKFGIPSSIILANAVRQSFAGKRDCAKRANNHFALPAADWAGATEACANGKMRRYESIWLSFRDHSLFLTSGKFAGIKQKYQPTEYKSWAKAMQDASYPANNNRLAEELILIIEKYQLYRLDKM